MTSAPASAPREGTTGQLLQLCAGYFLSYVGTGVVVKWFTGGLRQPPMGEIAFLFTNTLSSSVLCVLAVLAMGWLRLPAGRTRRWFGRTVPEETPAIVASGVCTAVIIPATTMLYTLPISVMVAMVIMRAAVIVISRAVDAVLLRRGLLKRRVHAEENWAVVFALLALGTHVLLLPVSEGLMRLGFDVASIGITVKRADGHFDFLGSVPAMSILVCYIAAYSVRLYVMNVFKLTRPPGPGLDNRGYFAIEQVTASATMALVAAVLIALPAVAGVRTAELLELRDAAFRMDWAAFASGVPYALVAFFSVFLFMFRGRTATFAGLVNRITSLLAGTTATLVLAWVFGLKPPSVGDWISLGFIGIAVALLARVETRRSRESAA